MPNTTFTHISWDAGALDFFGKPQSKKTDCGKRVPIAQIDDDNPTCPECIANKEAALELSKILSER